jgi:hypothetical protein
MILTAVLAGVLMGLSLGALGAGGAIITVPVLVYALGETAHEATTTSLVIVGLTAAAGALVHLRAGRVDWRRGLLFGAIGIGGTALGSWLSAGLDPDRLLLAFALLLLVVAVMMWRRAGGPAPVVAAAAASHDHRIHPVRVVLAAVGVGVLTGFFGVGGGFAVVPALVLALGFTMPMAVGTSLLVIALNSASALAGRLAVGITLDWTLVLVFAGAAMAGSLLGPRLVARVSHQTLSRVFAVILVVVGIGMAIESAAALAAREAEGNVAGQAVVR